MLISVNKIFELYSKVVEENENHFSVGYFSEPFEVPTPDYSFLFPKGSQFSQLINKNQIPSSSPFAPFDDQPVSSSVVLSSSFTSFCSNALLQSDKQNFFFFTSDVPDADNYNSFETVLSFLIDYSKDLEFAKLISGCSSSFYFCYLLEQILKKEPKTKRISSLDLAILKRGRIFFESKHFEHNEKAALVFPTKTKNEISKTIFPFVTKFLENYEKNPQTQKYVFFCLLVCFTEKIPENVLKVICNKSSFFEEEILDVFQEIINGSLDVSFDFHSAMRLYELTTKFSHLEVSCDSLFDELESDIESVDDEQLNNGLYLLFGLAGLSVVRSEIKSRKDLVLSLPFPKGIAEKVNEFFN